MCYYLVTKGIKHCTDRKNVDKIRQGINDNSKYDNGLLMALSYY